MIDALMLLDAYVRSHTPDYDRSPIERAITQAIRRAQKQTKTGLKRTVPLKGQRSFLRDQDAPAA